MEGHRRRGVERERRLRRVAGEYGVDDERDEPHRHVDEDKPQGGRRAGSAVSKHLKIYAHR